MADHSPKLIPLVKVNPANFTTYFQDTYNALVNPGLVCLGFFIGDVPSTGVKGFIPIPFSGEIVGCYLLANVAGDLVVDIWNDVTANFPPTVADTITAAAKPTLSAVQGVYDGTLTGWTTTITAGDIIAFNVDSSATISTATIALVIQKDAA